MLPLEQVLLRFGDLQIAGQVSELIGAAPGLGGPQVVLFGRELRALLIQLRPQFAVIERHQQLAGAHRAALDRRHGGDESVELRPQRVGIDRLHLAVAGDPGIQIAARDLGERHLRHRAAAIQIVKQPNRQQCCSAQQ